MELYGTLWNFMELLGPWGKLGLQPQPSPDCCVALLLVGMNVCVHEVTAPTVLQMGTF